MSLRVLVHKRLKGKSNKKALVVKPNSHLVLKNFTEAAVPIVAPVAIFKRPARLQM
jgi:hypothetical protein